MDQLRQDLRFAARSLLKQRSTTIIAALCLALGIGANTAIFSVVRAVLFAALPYRDPAGLVRLYETAIFQGSRGLGSVSVPNYYAWREQNTVFAGLAAWSNGSFDLSGDGEPERIRATRTTANLFRVVGADAAIGRTFAAGEDDAGNDAVAILSDTFWRRRYGADRSIVGRSISLDNRAYTVIGVMPAGFDFPLAVTRYDVYVPMVWTAQEKEQRGNHWLAVVARLRPGVDSTAAMANLETIARRLEAQYPDQQRERRVQVSGLEGTITGRVRTPLLMLLGAVGLVLLIACTNVANLLLARAAGRRHEIAIRTALGARRSHLVRQFLTESVLLGLAGGVLGVALAQLGLKAILVTAATSLPRAGAVGLDAGVLGFAAAMSVVTGLAFGIVPALRVSRTDVREDLAAAAGRTGTARRHQRTLGVLMTAEIALSLVLLIGAGLLIRGFMALIDTDPGLEPRGVLTFHVAAPAGTIADSARYAQFYGVLLSRLRAVPGVRSAATTTLLPIQQYGWNGNFTIVGRPQESDPFKQPFAEFRVVSGDYFRTLGIALTSGREFTDQDIAGAQPVVMVNDEFAKRYFPNEDPIGKQLLPWTSTPATIVGVASAVRQVGLDQPPRAELYVPAGQNPARLFDITYILSVRGDPALYEAAVRAAAKEVAPGQPVFRVATMEDVIATSLQARKLTLVLLAVFAAVALVLSAAGVYGVTSYGVSQRRREIGIRMALGARGADVTRMVLRDAARLAGAGTLIGLLAALGVTRVLRTMLYEVGVTDPLTFTLVPGIIVAVALIASALPALRASRVDPAIAFRAD